ncbi:MAG: uracil-DNA glycosylase, partial [Betaproteobacteria bacterium]|nr:uracil-DNA glycosylase [Betaproteobacteria bacterium]
MSASRDDIMKELGLTPVWRLRGTPTAEVSVSGSAGDPPAGQTLVRGKTSAGGSPALQEQVAEREPVTVRVLPKVVPLDARAQGIVNMEWPQLKESVAGCVACPLHKGRNKTVFGVGDEAAEWLFIGEGPGADE